MNWRPIETAPKDGTRILLGFKNDPEGKVQIGRWISEELRTNGVVMRTLDAWCYKGVVVKIDDSGSELWPTHWMPLPEQNFRA